MTAPRRVVPGSYYMITRRTLQQLFMLKPDDITNQIFEFCLGHAVNEYGVEPIAWEVLSNHYHLVIYDPQGNVPAFTQYLNRLLASVFNARWKRRENFWSSDEICITHLASEADVLEKVAYTLGNAVAAKLVDRVEDWPGASSLRYLDGEARRIARPGFYFKTKGSVVPESVELRAFQPRKSREIETYAAWATTVQSKVDEIDEEAATRRENDPEFRSLGVKAVLAAKITDQPERKKNDEGEDEPPEPKIRPRIACGEREKRIALIDEQDEFRFQHREARKQLASGTMHVVFPKGTYLLPPGCIMGKCPPLPANRAKRRSRIPSDDIVSTAPFAIAS